jgi:hypothetical protein
MGLSYRHTNRLNFIIYADDFVITWYITHIRDGFNFLALTLGNNLIIKGLIK